MAELFWLLLGAVVLGWGGYLVSTSLAASRRDMHRYARRHQYVEPDL